jgi:membrane-associated HD superfamily phosphohydrolase
MKKMDSPVKAVQSREEKELEEEALKKYKERRLKAKKKREAQQQQEMQRILEEKRSMEEELEELRQSAQSLSVAASNNNTSRAYTPNAPMETVGDSGGAEKKMAKMKKRFEKRLGAALDDLNDMRDVSIVPDYARLLVLLFFSLLILPSQDFYYQRKQLMDAMVEQEKDTKLYESICRSLLSEKDMKKVDMFTPQMKSLSLLANECRSWTAVASTKNATSGSCPL